MQPLADRVAIRPLEERNDARRAVHPGQPMQGEVIAVGPGRVEKGERVPLELKVGDKVLYGKYSGTEVRIDDEEILIVKESDVLAKIG